MLLLDGPENLLNVVLVVIAFSAGLGTAALTRPAPVQTGRQRGSRAPMAGGGEEDDMARAAGAVAALAGLGVTAQRVGSALRHRRDGDGGPGADDGRRWLVVTVNRSPDEVAPGGVLPPQLAALGDRIETRVSVAPGGRGTELAARLREPEPGGATGAVARVAGRDPRQEVRTALREAKSVLETGEVLQPDRPPSTHKTPLNAPLRAVSSLGRGEGRL